MRLENKQTVGIVTRVFFIDFQLFYHNIFQKYNKSQIGHVAITLLMSGRLILSNQIQMYTFDIEIMRMCCCEPTYQLDARWWSCIFDVAIWYSIRAFVFKILSWNGNCNGNNASIAVCTPYSKTQFCWMMKCLHFRTTRKAWRFLYFVVVPRDSRFDKWTNVATGARAHTQTAALKALHKIEHTNFIDKTWYE